MLLWTLILLRHYVGFCHQSGGNRERRVFIALPWNDQSLYIQSVIIRESLKNTPTHSTQWQQYEAIFTRGAIISSGDALCLCPPALLGEMRSQYRGRGWWWWWGWGWGWVWRRSNAAAECLMWQLEIVRMRGDTELQRPRPRPVIQPRLSVSHSPRFQLCVLLCY